ncbi:LacI family DNA-binding transcriptional regulator [Phycicoccus sp. 3266]|uniref:LacI family DNA-binding transcriptional regulator n=1 Tax=Phycicoccus sp. 3266 TaxID=2817751 RepID=UPI00285CB7BE|nr:LacI family DNA-binding transcriptional regulator [Phycicoccus sp. 3266]MDR6862829.1 DNA-binding LacI/PurR family transcriptional regulator [Phycicoccus sp. 3266]
MAKAAGVSRTAVSFAFNDPARLSDGTRERILQAAAELGYSPDPLARMLKSGRTGTLGLLLPQDISQVMQNPYYAQFLTGVGQVCQQEGMTLLLCPPLRSSMLKAIPYAAVDGFIVTGLESDRGEVAELQRRGVPFVLVDSDAGLDVPTITADDQQGAYELVRHLTQLGHTRIAFLLFDSGPTRTEEGYRGPLRRRLDGAATALAEVGLSLESPEVMIVEAPCTRSGGYTAALDIMNRDDPPTAVVAFSDILAIGALDAMASLGLNVPGDVSVAGYDDQPEAEWANPRLTTVRQPIEAKGRLAGDYLVAAIRGEDQRPHQQLQGTLVVRDSTGPAPTTRGPASHEVTNV